MVQIENNLHISTLRLGRQRIGIYLTHPSIYEPQGSHGLHVPTIKINHFVEVNRDSADLKQLNVELRDRSYRSFEY